MAKAVRRELLNQFPSANMTIAGGDNEGPAGGYSMPMPPQDPNGGMSPTEAYMPMPPNPDGGMRVPDTSSSPYWDPAAAPILYNGPMPTANATIPFQGSQGQPNITGAQVGSDPHRDAVADAYRRYLGREMSEQDYQNWAGNGNAVQEISRSPEAMSRGGTAPAAQGVSREQYRDAWMGSGAASMADLQRFVAQYGGTILGDNGTVRTPYGETLDMLIGAKGAAAGGPAARPGWTAQGGGGAAPGAPGAGGGSSDPASDPNTFQGKVRQMILDQLTKLGQPVTADDPTISGEMTAQSRLAERERQARRSASAERAANNGFLGGGQSSGVFEADVQSGYQDQAEGLSDIQSQLFTREITARRQQLSQLLALATQTGDAESTRALQLKLAEMDDAIRRAGLAEGARQHDDNFGLEAGRFKYGQDRDTVLFGYGGY